MAAKKHLSRSRLAEKCKDKEVGTVTVDFRRSLWVVFPPTYTGEKIGTELSAMKLWAMWHQK